MYTPLRFQHWHWLLLVGVVTFSSVLLWARSQDPFARTYFSISNGKGSKLTCVAIRPKTLDKAPVVIYLHNSGEPLVKRGVKLRQLAELGFAAVNIDYDDSRTDAFDLSFANLREYLKNQPWAQPEAMVWFGYGKGAERGLDFVLQNKASQPQLLVLLATAQTPAFVPEGGPSLTCKVLIIQGRNDTALPIQENERLQAALRDQGAVVEHCTLDNFSHQFGQDEDVVTRHIAEYCASHFHEGGKSFISENKFSWLCLGPLFLLASVGTWAGWRKLTRVCHPTELSTSLKRFWAFTVIVLFLALAQTSAHLVLPLLPASDKTISASRTFLVRAEWLEDFDYLTRDNEWFGKPVNHLLTHVELAHLQRTQFYRKPNEAIYRDYVLSPAIGRDSDEWGWRRTFWDAFYPRIRKQKKPVQGAETVARFLRERVGINNQNASRGGVETFWREGVADAQGFEELYVAAMRSVGIGARLDQGKKAELWTGSEWQAAPRPLHFEFPSQQETIVGKN